ncbi:MAG: YebC/PmpR family DNA-binding transcriptional regulator [Bacteroidales bacterium]|nr:YebC/PmpR family DNA-binding transcriptional regulator [Bacteroidales bacterium]MBP5241549.1 YebC/PmpR family DNA-binding transcriptional regulator [Bacteroidales bacterium]MBP5758712.1 YebC/PmpR family DNA-binding transcriptional regulator [Bacteroidales bacterium]
MSGHNKWSKIKRQKGATDAKRSKAFSRILKEVTVAVKESGPDPDGNPRLRLLMQNAKGVNMPKDTLMRAITKASDKDSAALQELTFECYAPHGIAIFIECLTDNNMRSVANVRSIMNKFGGTLGTNGSLGFIFDRKGVFQIKRSAITMDLDELEMELIDAGLEEMESDEEYITLYTAMEDFGAMVKKLEDMKIEVESAELQRIPNTTKTIDEESMRKVLKIVDLLEEDDDVQAVYHDMEIPEDFEE